MSQRVWRHQAAPLPPPKKRTKSGEYLIFKISVRHSRPFPAWNRLITLRISSHLPTILYELLQICCRDSKEWVKWRTKLFEPRRKDEEHGTRPVTNSQVKLHNSPVRDKLWTYTIAKCHAQRTNKTCEIVPWYNSWRLQITWCPWYRNKPISHKRTKTQPLIYKETSFDHVLYQTPHASAVFEFREHIFYKTLRSRSLNVCRQ